jgi:hypothetical protein
VTQQQPGTLQLVLAPLAGAALIFALAWGGWSIYRRLPEGEATSAGSRRGGVTAVRVRLRRPADYAQAGGERIAVQLYPLSVDAARKEFESERRPGLRFEEFLRRRMAGREPVTAELDERDEVALTVPQGRWWIHATLDGPEELSWRLSVNVTGREKPSSLRPTTSTRAREVFRGLRLSDFSAPPFGSRFHGG